MENKNPQKSNLNDPQWGDHNPKLTEENFIDRNPKKISDQNELLAPSNAPIDLSKEKPAKKL